MQASVNRIIAEKKNFYFLRGIDFIVKDPFPVDIDMEKVMGLLRSNLPHSCYDGINNVYFGKFDILNKRQLTAIHYKDNIYLDSDKIDNEEDMLDDLIHEFAHRFEENNSEAIYEDGLIVGEFIGKRNRLFDLLSQEHNFEKDDKINYFDFLNTEYDKELDNFLYNIIGYEKITNLAPTLFIRPYAATSLREYFATGFEDYYLNGGQELKNISPVLYNRIETLNKNSDFKRR